MIDVEDSFIPLEKTSYVGFDAPLYDMLLDEKLIAMIFCKYRFTSKLILIRKHEAMRKKPVSELWSCLFSWEAM